MAMLCAGSSPGDSDHCQLLEDGTVLITDLRIDRENLIAGLFYSVQNENRWQTASENISAAGLWRDGHRRDYSECITDM